MESRALTRLHPRTAQRERRFAAFTLLEAIVVFVLIGIVLGVAVVRYSDVHRTQLDRDGYPLLGAAHVDARRVADSAGRTYPDQGTLTTSMNRSAAAVNGRALTYIGDPSPDAAHVSVSRGDAMTAGFAVMTSMQGSWDAGTASDGHCLMMVDSLKNGQQYATLDDAIRGGTNYCGAAFVLSCQSQLNAASGLPGDGTTDSPYQLSSSTACTDTVDADPVQAPKCVVASPVPAVPGSPTRSASLSWVPADNTSTTFTYTIVTSGPNAPADVTGIPGGARAATVDGLTPGATYTFAVYAVNSAGKKYGPSPSSNQLLTAPGEVTAPVVTPGVGNLRLTWAQVPGAATYAITRTPAFSPAATVSVADATAVNGQLAYTDTTVANGISYIYRITAVSPSPVTTSCAMTVTGGGRTTSSLYPVGTPLLAAPTLTVTSAPTGTTGFSLSWTSVSGADHYLIRRTDPQSTTVTSAAAADTTLPVAVTPDAGATTLTDTSLPPASGANLWVTYQVASVDASGTVTWGNTDAGLFAPDSPDITAVTPTSGAGMTSLDVSWAKAATASTYTVTRDGTNVATVNDPTAAYTDASLTAGSTHTYTVTASNYQAAFTLNSGGPTHPVGGTTTSAAVNGTTLPAVGDLTITANNTARSFTVTWADVAGATGYTIEGSSDGGTTWATLSGAALSGGTWTLTDTNGGAGFPNGQVRVYRMTVATASTPQYAKPAAAAIAPSYPTFTATPSPLSAAGTSDVTVSGSSQGATAVTVTNGANTTVPVTGNTAAGKFTFTGTDKALARAQWVREGALASLAWTKSLAASGGFPAVTLTVKASSAAAPLPAPVAGTNTCPSSTTTVGAAWPSGSTLGCLTYGKGVAYATAVTPTTIISVTGRHDLTVAWDTVPAVPSYQVFRAGGQVASATTLVGTTAGGRFTDTSTADGSWYTYQVSPAGLPSSVGTAKSPARSGLTVPSAPTLSAFVTGTTVSLTWPGVASATSYTTYRAGALSSPLATSPATSYTEDGQPGTQYSYQVTANNAAGASDPSSATAPLWTVPMTPAWVQASAGQNSATVSWAATRGATSYQVWRDAANGNYQWVYTTTDTSWHERPLVADVTYHYRIAAVNDAGTSALSTAAAVTPASSYAAAVLADRPFSYYRLGDSAGSLIAQDATAYNRDAQYRSNGRAAAQPHVPGFMHHWDADTAVALDAAAKANIWRSITGFTNAQDFTMETWVYLTGHQNGSWMEFGGTSCQTTNGRVNQAVCNGAFGATGGPDPRYSAGVSPNVPGNTLMGAMTGQYAATGGGILTTERAGGWNHLVLTGARVDSNTVALRFYDNGTLVDASNVDVTNIKPSGQMVVGGESIATSYWGAQDSLYMSGYFDEAAFYAYPLSATQVAHHYNVGRQLMSSTCDYGGQCGN